MVFIEVADEKPVTTFNENFDSDLESWCNGLGFSIVLLLASSDFCRNLGNNSPCAFFFLSSL